MPRGKKKIESSNQREGVQSVNVSPDTFLGISPREFAGMADRLPESFGDAVLVRMEKFHTNNETMRMAQMPSQVHPSVDLKAAMSAAKGILRHGKEAMKERKMATMAREEISKRRDMLSYLSAKRAERYEKTTSSGVSPEEYEKLLAQGREAARRLIGRPFDVLGRRAYEDAGVAWVRALDGVSAAAEATGLDSRDVIGKITDLVISSEGKPSIEIFRSLRALGCPSSSQVAFVALAECREYHQTRRKAASSI